MPNAARSQAAPHDARAGSGYHRGMADAAETGGGARAGLYERLLGEGWGRLDEPVRGFHAPGGGVKRAKGEFAVRRGSGLAARALARLLGLPPSGGAVPLLLSVEPLGGGGERWRRNFAGREFVTEQREHAGLLLAERAGPFETLFRLAVEGGALAYRGEGAALRVGPLRLRLPRRLAPRVEAWERASEGGGVRVSVHVEAPLFGHVISYGGLVRTLEGEG